MDTRHRASRAPHADARLRGDARDRDGGVRQGLAAGGAWKQPAPLPSLNVKTVRSWRGILPSTHLAREGRMTVTIGRRELLVALSGAAAAWPLAAGAQQPAMPVIGFLSAGFPEAYAPFLVAFRTGLGESGYVEGRNGKIEYRWAEGQFDRLPVLAADLVHRSVAAIVTSGVSSGLAARAAASTIPHVFLSQDDPVKLKFVASFNRPGGNATGVALLTSVLVKKRLELARELVPTAAVIAVLANPNSPEFAAQMSDVQVAAQSLGQQIHVVNAGRDGDFDSAFAALLEQRPGALLVTTDAFLYS